MVMSYRPFEMWKSISLLFLWFLYSNVWSSNVNCVLLSLLQAISKEGVAPQELGKMKSEFLAVLDNHPLVAKLIHTYT
jgi:hypothetical protein